MRALSGEPPMDDDGLNMVGPPASLSCILQAHGLEAHRHAIESALQATARIGYHSSATQEFSSSVHTRWKQPN